MSGSSGPSRSLTQPLEIGLTRLPAGHSLLVRGVNFGASKVNTGGGLAPPPCELPLSSGLSARLRSFLPTLASANVALEALVLERGTAAVDIEAVDEDAPHIAMDLAVAELAEGADYDSSSSDDEASSDEDGKGAGAGAGSRKLRAKIQEVGGSGAGAGVGAGAGAAQAWLGDGFIEAAGTKGGRAAEARADLRRQEAGLLDAEEF